MSFRDELEEAIGQPISAHTGIPLVRGGFPKAGDEDVPARLIALEHNIDRLERAVLLIADKLDAQKS